jgi:hypothetical protein
VLQSWAWQKKESIPTKVKIRKQYEIWRQYKNGALVV